MQSRPIHKPIFKNEYIYSRIKELGLLGLKISNPIENFALIQKRINLDIYKPLIASNEGMTDDLYVISLQNESEEYIGSIDIAFYKGEYNAYYNALAPFELVSGPTEHLRNTPNNFSDITLALHDGYVVSTRGNIVLLARTRYDTSALELNKITMNMIFDKK